MTRTTFLLLAALCSPGVFAATVEAFEADPLTLLDAHGKSQGTLALKDAPKPPLPVLESNPNLELVQVELGGRKVWLDTMDLRIEPPLNVVDLPCQGLTKSQTKDSRNNSTIGFGAGCNQ